jgi:hypothetical protein
MNPTFFLTICFFLAATFCEGQMRSIIFKAEAGLSVSVGREHEKLLTSSINPFFSFFQIDNRHYKFPGFRFRIAAMQPLNSFFSLGIRTGANVHYFENNTYGQKVTYFTYPLQGVAEMSLKQFRTRALYFLLAAGHRFRHADEPPFHYRGGIIASTELSFGKKGKEPGLFYKVGIDYSKEARSYDYVPPADLRVGVKETISTRFYRTQAFLAFGANF